MANLMGGGWLASAGEAGAAGEGGGLGRLRRVQVRDRALFGLSRDYTIAFIVDLETDAYEIVFTQRTNHAQVHREIGTYAEYVADYAERFVVPDQRDVFRHELNHATIGERFKDRDDYYYSFETSPNAAGLCHFQAHIIKEYDDYGRFAFLGFRSVDEVVKRERFFREELEKANCELEKQLDLITSALPGGVKISNDDETYSFKYVSEQFATMLGYSDTDELMEAANGSIVGLAHPDDVEMGIGDALAQYAVSDNYATTYRVRCKDGSYKYVEDRGRKFIAPDGTVEHWNLFLDKNELMEKTIELESERKASLGKSEFLSRMSHDMRTPLNGILGLFDICAKHPDDRQLVDASRAKARVAAEHLLSLINDTLELSKLENREVQLSKEAFHAPSLFHDTETIARMRADKDDIDIYFDGAIDGMLYPYLIGSPLYVKQIYLNLIANSIKYNREGGSVRCGFKERLLEDGRVQVDVSIRDTGIGMSKDFLKDVFKPFVQADHGPRSTYRGTGLGMAIVKNLLDRMGGSIDIESEEGVGTAIVVSLPFEVADKSDLEGDEVPLHRVDLHGIRVLLAEDNELNREIAAFVMRDVGIEVTEAVDGCEALAAFVNNPEHCYDVVLMDMMMPRMNGYEAIRAIRACGKADAASVPIIALTANAFDDDRRKTEAAGANMHLSKPVASDRLIEAIERFCLKR